jgi:hypothetical protein
MNRARVFALTVALLCCLVLMSPSHAMQSSQYAINWSVVGSGGGPMRSTNYGLNSTAGQNASGFSRSTTYELCAGYWCGAAAEYGVYLPLVLRNA